MIYQLKKPFLFYQAVYYYASTIKDIPYRSGFPKLLIHWYPLDTVAGLHVPPKFCDISLKQKGFQLESATNFPPIHAQNQGDL